MIKLHQFPPAFGLPNASPFCMKVENYLRMAKLPYEPIYGLKLSQAPKGKLPFIEDQGRLIGDSGLIIDYLKSRYGDPLDEGLAAADRASALALTRLMDEHLYWAGLIQTRWMEEDGFRSTRRAYFAALPAPLRAIVPPLARRGVVKQMKGHGLGRHTRDEIYAMACADIGALADFLGDKPYFLGDRPTSLDAGAYAFIANILQVPYESPAKSYSLTRPNLETYCRRMKDAFYSDWPQAAPE